MLEEPRQGSPWLLQHLWEGLATQRRWLSSFRAHSRVTNALRTWDRIGLLFTEKLQEHGKGSLSPFQTGFLPAGVRSPSKVGCGVFAECSSSCEHLHQLLCWICQGKSFGLSVNRDGTRQARCSPGGGSCLEDQRHDSLAPSHFSLAFWWPGRGWLMEHYLAHVHTPPHTS